MRAINHALTGSLIGLLVGQPFVALPAALASHFICDIIPHHGSSMPDSDVMKSKAFLASLGVDALLCFGLVLVLAIRQPEHWMLAAICAFLAASPDFLFLPRYLAGRLGKTLDIGRFVQWTMDIQWFQRPIGAVVEVAWFIGAVVLLLPLL